MNKNNFSLRQPTNMAPSTTCYLAARLISDFLGYITKKRELK